MARQPKKGYFVRGQFVAEGSALDLELKAEPRGASKSELKRESAQLQAVGEELLQLRGESLNALHLPEKLVEALTEARRITSFEGKRRQLQFVGKLMRGLDEATLERIRDALDAQRKGSAGDSLTLHQAEQWRDKLIAGEDALDHWLRAYPGTDTQQLRALIRQARKDVQPDQDVISKGLAPRQGRAYREIFQLVKEQLSHEGPPSQLSKLT